ncbi:MAG: cysteine hydrolase [Acidobacteria bacterium]|nr:cysteine hydrolase [Acidobacteriota bacterium]
MEALLLVDVQLGLSDPARGRRNNPQAESNMGRLLNFWRAQSWPVIHIQHDSEEKESLLRPGLPGHALHPAVTPLPGESLFHKTVHSAFIGTPLESLLRQNAIHSLVIAGLTTDHCVSTTVRMAADLGFRVTLVSDATAAFECVDLAGAKLDAEWVHQVQLASLQGEFCHVATTETVLRDRQH